MTKAPAAVDVRIGRLVVDADALAGMPRAEFGEGLRREIARRLAGGEPGQCDTLVERVAAEVVARAASATPSLAAAVRPGAAVGRGAVR